MRPRPRRALAEPWLFLLMRRRSRWNSLYFVLSRTGEDSRFPVWSAPACSVSSPSLRQFFFSCAFFSVGDARQLFKAIVFDQSRRQRNGASCALATVVSFIRKEQEFVRSIFNLARVRPHEFEQTCSSQLRPPASFSITRTPRQSIALPSPSSRRG